MSHGEARLWHHDYPYRLRLAHPDGAELRVERKGRWLRIDPATAPDPEEIAILTGPSPTRLRATAEAARAGKTPQVLAPEPIAAWLRAQGPIRDAAPLLGAEGLSVEWMPYTPAAASRPLGAALRARLRTDPRPAADPHVVQIAFPDGSRLLHLDLSLHARTEEAWVDAAVARFGAPEWLLVGVEWGEARAIVRHVPRFAAKRVLLLDIGSAERREAGLPTELVTPCRDELVAAGVEAHVFATQASYRFE